MSEVCRQHGNRLPCKDCKITNLTKRIAEYESSAEYKRMIERIANLEQALGAMTADKRRHDELAEKMLSRGYNHKSPLNQPDFSYLQLNEVNAVVDQELSLELLISRCAQCAERMKHV